ncbi:hypothetical protein [Labedella phragmitis]|uniref:hypothetical protein n=1 Tax=Labedella phragmitis TaxID=2498849 RepID=UPI00140BFAB8|nr:hypothetical protein [Labedella phragmitis]
MQNRETFSTTVWKQSELLRAAVESIRESVAGASIGPWKPGETVALVSMGA